VKAIRPFDFLASLVGYPLPVRRLSSQLGK
jgi:hypothetical protein